MATPLNTCNICSFFLVSMPLALKCELLSEEARNAGFD